MTVHEAIPHDAWQRRQEKEVRDLIIMASWPMLCRVVGRLRQHLPPHVRIDEPDLRSYGLIGLYKALDKYDPDHGTPFDKFASSYVWGAVHDELRTLDWAPRALRKRQREMEFAKHKFARENDQPPNDEELAQILRWTTDDVANTRRQVDTAWPRSLDEIRVKVEQDLYSVVADAAGNPEEILIKSEEPPENDRSALINDRVVVGYIDRLPTQQKAVVVLCYFLGKKQGEVAKLLGIPESRVSSLHLSYMEGLTQELEKLLRVPS